MGAETRPLAGFGASAALLEPPASTTEVAGAMVV